MNRPNAIASSSFVRNLSYSLRRALSDFLDPQDRWKDVLVSILKPSGEPRYSQLHVRRFESLVSQGRSPTLELLSDWGTSNCTVGELVDILLSLKLLAPASLLLPDKVQEKCSAADSLPDDPSLDKDTVHNLNNHTPTSPVHNHTPTRPLGETQRPLSPLSYTPSVPSDVQDGFSRFSFSELQKVTGSFDERPVSDGGSRLGEGGFGTVFKGVIKGKPVAVKKLHPVEDVSMEELRVQFNQEIQTLMTLKHGNLVNMIGFSSDDLYPCLVYVYMSNGSLLDRLACLDGTPPLPWIRRCLINEGTARGLEYLHRQDHIHRDVKSGNILLDDELVPKISDFGLTRALVTSSATMMTQRIVGTTAYMASEALRGEITSKSDVFSFGVVMLETLSGLPPFDENREPQLLIELKAEIEDEEVTLKELVDEKMGDDVDMVQVERTCSLAFRCLSDKKNKRPVIKEVLAELEDVVRTVSLERRSQESEA